ncbi:hypothetical protein ACFOD1_07830 [Pseudidiomarina halophila]|uniref:Uncharacterized protein n=1 Tax=Pseudidiomarina halophila TaxID=1449799 RepID=A0A432XRQ3_9GAMM|nr:hypothetical protein [Pseudidiomarina halophila]RUO51370.1 hypothetical protein CWI69_11835 [Pseudidiomarina halophila]
MDLPMDWQGELLARQPTHSIWRVSYPQPPQLEKLGCAVNELPQVGFWCEHQGSLWLLQKQQDDYWLTRFSASQTMPSKINQNWRGAQLQKLLSEGQELSIYLSKQHPEQLLQFVKFRHRGREPRLLELNHGRFHLSLQKPTEDLFLYSHGGQTLVVSARPVRPGDI